MQELNYVAINYITCKAHYKPRFEELFASRKGAIDSMPGFHHMEVLKPFGDDDVYLIISHWENVDSFKTWTRSEAFLEGHKRGFEDLKTAKENGEEAPMSSSFKTYNVISR
jgi:heme-degrading monooxygenase HmoA